jgi:hypothetical protein
MTVEIKRAATELASKVKGALAGGALGSIASVAGLDSIVLWFWNDLLHSFLAFLPMMPDNVATAIIALIGVLAGGWVTPDKLPSGTTAQLPGFSGGSVVAGDVKTPAAQQKEIV